MVNAPANQEQELKRAFLANERLERLHTGRIASALVVFLMPVGITLDYFVYRKHVLFFFGLRLVCSALTGVIWFLHNTSLGHRYYKVLGLPIALLPSFFISWMIYRAGDAASPYYAGLSLILLAVSVVVHWSVRESLLAMVGVLIMYSAACWLSGADIVYSNFYFLVLTGSTVVIGNYFFNQMRFREFVLTFELDQHKKVLEENNQKLKELDQIKSRFFANISHELRTPLTLLLAPIETLLQRFSRSFDEETRGKLLTMQANGMRLLKLINDLLDLVRLESGKIEVKREPLQLGDFVKGLASAVRQVADDKRLQFETDVDPTLGTVMGDRDKLEKVLLNLLFNAIKFTPAGGLIRLRVQKKDDQLALSVSDTGMGISEKNLPFVFDRFWQADGSSKRKYQGVGIGLALAKELVEVQGGRIAVRSEEGKGTTFTITLPYQKSEARPDVKAETTPAPATVNKGTVTSEEWLSNLYRRAEMFPAMTSVHESLRPVETNPNGHKPSILIADDEPDMLRFLKSELSSEYHVHEAVDGQQAVDKTGQFLPDLIVLDMMMPEKDGLQACREIRERTSTRSIPILLLTARADEDTKLASLSAGASDFLAKPFSTTELRVRIKNLVESYAYQRKLAKQNIVLESTIEQLKDTETQLVQSEKLASLGRLSAGIIHEINNPLNYAMTGVFTLRKKGSELDTRQRGDYDEILDDVEEGIKRVRNIVTDLRSFTRQDNDSMETVDVQDAVASALRFTSGEWKNAVRIEQKIPEGQALWGNKNKLVQVLVNLLQNSLDALKSKKFAGEQPKIWLEGRVENNKSVLLVRDNGIGILADHRDKVFDPFFTTKEVGKGMGLGLSICYRIVQEFGGRMSLSTEVGKFCEFTLEFPVKASN